MAKLFDAFKLKDVTLRNRVVVSPMCEYSSVDGFPTDWHLVHLGSRAVGGAALVVVEATAVSRVGRISPADSGIYVDEQVEPFARIVRFMKRHGAAAGIQLAHAGRKASTSVPWNGGGSLTDAEGGWETMAPSSVAFGGDITRVPREMSLSDIADVQGQFVDAARRALAAGFEWLELHFAHGYLAHEFYSPLSNKRTDGYGGSFEHRIRFMMETLAAVKKVWPERLPLTARLSVTDWVEGGVTVEESIELVKRMKEAGLDLLDVSHGFAGPSMAGIPWGPGFMAPVSGRIRKLAGIATGVGWMITDPAQAEEILQKGEADLVVLAREMLRDPYWPYRAAMALGDERGAGLLPVQYARSVVRR